MKAEIIMPKVDMVMETGTLVEWLKKEGDAVKKGEPLFVISTDKATIECESPATGVLAGVTAKPDDVIPVTEVIGYIISPGETLESIPASKPAGSQSAPTPKTEAPTAATAQVVPAVLSVPQKVEGEDVLVRATPLARSLARELGVDLSRVVGRGPHGRIYRSDVMVAVEQLKTQPPKAAGLPIVAAVDMNIPMPNARVRERVLLKGARSIIAERMSFSASTIPHINESVTVNMEEAVRLRDKVSPAIEKMTGLKVSYTAIIALAVAKTLTRHPYLNASLNGKEVILWEDIHLGLATSLEDYLIVPVIREAQNKNLEGIAQEMARLLEAARSKKLEPSEMSGSTFTITNLGMFGIENFTAIINPPEVAILAVGRMLDMPVVIDGQVVVRPMMNLTLATDHRVNDGARAARFLTDLKAYLENPYLLL